MARVEIEGEIINANGEGLALYGNALAGTNFGNMKRFVRWYMGLSAEEQYHFDRLVAPDNPILRVAQSEARRRDEHPLSLPMLVGKLGW